MPLKEQVPHTHPIPCDAVYWVASFLPHNNSVAKIGHSHVMVSYLVPIYTSDPLLLRMNKTFGFLSH